MIVRDRTQREYYARTAADYDALHTREHDEHDDALQHVVAHLRSLGAESVLDTGCGTARGLRAIQAALPDIVVRGNDSSPELLGVAVARHGVLPDLLDCVPSESLPYDDASFDAVVATGLLHHVPEPSLVVTEMLRVARLAVFISDSNIYGQGARPLRVLKLVLARLRLLPALNRLRRGGEDWYYSDEDGLAYSYSVFDSLPLIRRACRHTHVHATGRGSRRFPLLGSSHVLLCGFKADA